MVFDIVCKQSTGPGVSSLAAVGTTPNVNAATLTASTLQLQPASSTLPGVVTELTQTLGGAKTFGKKYP